MFTRVFIQCRQVAVPMDILKMALYEKIKTGKITSTPHETEEKSKTMPPVVQTLQETKMTSTVIATTKIEAKSEVPVQQKKEPEPEAVIINTQEIKMEDFTP